MSDPLSMVRQFTMDGASVINAGGEYVFGSVKFSEKAETSFKRSIGGGDSYYTLKDVIFFLGNMDLSLQEYRKKVVSARVTAIVEADKQDLKDYLLGTIASCKQIDSAKAAASSSRNEGSGGAASSSSSSAAAAQPSSEAPMDVERSTKKSSGKSSTEKRGSRVKRSREMAADGEFDLSRENLASDAKKLSKAKEGDIPVADRCSVLRATTLGADPFKFALNLFNQHILKPIEDAKKGIKSDGGAKSETKKSYSKPIIIVPQSFTTLLNSANIEDFLIKSTYVPVEDKRQQGVQRVAVQTLSRSLDRAAGTATTRGLMSNGKAPATSLDFKVVENPSKTLKDEDWDSVVAVFATGQDWQFKDWKKGYNTPVDLFNKVLGIHLVMEGAPVHANIEKWNCRVMKVHPYERQRDQIIVGQFWDAFDTFLRVNRADHCKYLGLGM